MLMLPETPEREAISRAIYQAQQFPDEESEKINAAMADNLTALGLGMRVVALGNTATDQLNRCEHYALGTVLGESWAQPGQELPKDLRGGRDSSTDDFLTSGGYGEDYKWRAGYLAMYLAGPRRNYAHFGIVTPDGIESKFGSGPVMAHAVGHVPIVYGHSVVFYRPPRDARTAYNSWVGDREQPGK